MSQAYNLFYLAARSFKTENPPTKSQRVLVYHNNLKIIYLQTPALCSSLLHTRPHTAV
ncbi:hypothetical protein C7475_102186 [Chitinophaga sp. S165]|nr:hypothetical protein C7475_102186 [Chitinophaga sp. S165]